jgi:hypothetical protein
LTLTGLARAWPDAERIAGPLKKVDRLLGNRHLQGERAELYAAMTRLLLAALPEPVIVVDWSELNRRQHALLRAALVWQGRTLTLTEIVTPYRQNGSPNIESALLERLAEVLPAKAKPVLVTDAGFGPPWFLKVAARGWCFVGRIRSSRMRIRPACVPDVPDQWVVCRELYAALSSSPRKLDDFVLSYKHRMPVTLVLHRKQAKGRVRRTLTGTRSRDSRSCQVAAREREPWLLAVSPKLSANARQLVALYAKRMQIEQGFRDLKSQRFGVGYADSLSRHADRIANLLCILALTSFAAWVCACIAPDCIRLHAQARWCRHVRRRVISWFRLGMLLLRQPDPLRIRIKTLEREITRHALA